METTNKIAITERRRFLTLMAQGGGLVALSGMVWTGYLEEAKSAPLILRPPGAVVEIDFMRLCIKCGQCYQKCKFDAISVN